MERSSAVPSELIVDTSFLLPYVGIKVRGLDESVLDGKQIHYPSLMLIELLAVIIKEAKKVRLPKLPDRAIEGLTFVLSNVSLVPFEILDVNLVYEVINKGWNDVFDAVLYSASISTGLPLLSMDRTFYGFLRANEFDTSNFVLYAGNE